MFFQKMLEFKTNGSLVLLSVGGPEVNTESGPPPHDPERLAELFVDALVELSSNESKTIYISCLFFHIFQILYENFNICLQDEKVFPVFILCSCLQQLT